jgi:hypothetical protein
VILDKTKIYGDAKLEIISLLFMCGNAVYVLIALFVAAFHHYISASLVVDINELPHIDITSSRPR